MKRTIKTTSQTHLFQKKVSFPVVVLLVVIAVFAGRLLAPVKWENPVEQSLVVASPSPLSVKTLTYDMISTPDTSTWKTVKYPNEKIQFKVPQDWMIENTTSSILIGKAADVSGMAARPQNDIGLYLNGIKTMVSSGGMLNETVLRQEIMVGGYKAYFGSSEGNDFSEVEIPLRDRLRLIMMIENSTTLPIMKGILSTLQFK